MDGTRGIIQIQTYPPLPWPDPCSLQSPPPFMFEPFEQFFIFVETVTQPVTSYLEGTAPSLVEPWSPPRSLAPIGRGANVTGSCGCPGSVAGGQVLVGSS